MFGSSNPVIILLHVGKRTTLKAGDVIRFQHSTGLASIARSGELLVWRNQLIGADDDKRQVLSAPFLPDAVRNQMALISALTGLNPCEVDRGPDYVAFEMTEGA